MTSKIGTKILPTTSSSTSRKVSELFKNNPETYFTQAEMVQEFSKTNPCINKVLRVLVATGEVGRTKVGSKYYYNLK